LPKAENNIAALLSRGFVSLNKFAQMIDVTYPTAHRMYNRGEIKGIRVGGVIRVYSDEIKRFLNEGNASSVESAGGEIPPATSSDE